MGTKEEEECIEIEVDAISQKNIKNISKLCKTLQLKFGFRDNGTMIQITKIPIITESEKITYENLLNNYRNDPTKITPINMPCNLSSIHRRYIHTLCNKYGLCSKSYGNKNNINSRYLQISKYNDEQKKKEKNNKDYIFPLLMLGQDTDNALRRHVHLYPFDEKYE